MYLETVPDYFDEATHQKLDKAVNDDVRAELEEEWDAEIREDWQHQALLWAIIAHSNDRMDMKYLKDIRQNITLFKIYGKHLREVLSSAWKKKSYRTVRNLAILRAQKAIPIALGLADVDVYRKLTVPFQATYSGAAVDGFYEYLTHNEKLFRNPGGNPYYAKFCSIVQSSGTGKSRVLTQLSTKDVIVIYMNLRGKDEQFGFPRPDPVPSEILTKFPNSWGLYRAACYAFFIALFDTVEEHLSKSTATNNPKADIMSWVHQMCDVSDPPASGARTDFFVKVSQRYEQVHDDFVHILSTSGTQDSFVANEFKQLSLSDSKPSPPDRDFAAGLFSAYEKMVSSLKKIFDNDSDNPKLVIGIDEAHPLTRVQERGEGQSYRPADVMCRAVNEYSHHENYPIWIVFASTTSKVADFSPPSQKYNSNRVSVKGHKLFTPYTQLGWDQSAPALGDIGVEAVSRLNHIVGYGRPLWMSLIAAFGDSKRMIQTATGKLCGEEHFDPNKINHVLAVLGQRFELTVAFGHPDSVEQLEGGVASHLRICLATTLDRNWRFTSYPSEPLLSCVAAHVLHEFPEKLGPALQTLLNVINSGMVEIGKRGELASRILWLLAKDLFVRQRKTGMVVKISSTEKPRAEPSSTEAPLEEHLLDCQMISVVDWLEFIFGEQVWKKNAQASQARKAFKDAYLNFSHWTGMDADIAGTSEDGGLSLEELTLRHWYRTSAVQCRHYQPIVDKMVPIYFKDVANETPSEPRMSQIFISDKVGKRSDSKNALHSITRRHKSLSGENALSAPNSNSLPYIAILADFGQPPSLDITFPERNAEDRCLRVHASGVSEGTYPFLDKHPALMVLKNLVHLQQLPQVETPFMQYLDAQVKFGSTPSRAHMEWERGQRVPDL